MKNIFLHITLIAIIIGSFLLGNFFFNHFENHKIRQIHVSISPIDKNFILPTEIKKMIVLNDTLIKSLDVEKIENKLEQNKFIANAEVYKDLNANVYAYVEQFTPIARVIGNTSYYIDTEGAKRPLSTHYTENVILVFGNPDSQQLKDTYQLIKKINADNYLKSVISEIHPVSTKKFFLKLNNYPFDVYLGSIENTKQKLNKLKILLSYFMQNKIPKNKYKRIDLSIENQVVCQKNINYAKSGK